MTMVLNEGGEVAIVEDHAKASAVSWGAVIAGAVAAAAVSLLLLLIGSGLGLTVISPWSANPSLTAIAATALVWLVVVHWVASAVGGFLAGRLRTSSAIPGADEVAFRDTAHGFLTWGVATLLVAVISGMAASTALLTGVQATATVAAGAASGQNSTPGNQAGTSGSAADPTAYFVDQLFRPVPGAPAATPVNAELRGEVSRILVKGVAADQFPGEDRTYLVDVAARTGLPPDAARMRVDSVLASLQDAKAKAKEAADVARKAAATAALGLALALLIGAFVASVAAALGGQLRDDPTR